MREERRRHPRTRLKPPFLGVARRLQFGHAHGDTDPGCVVDLHDLSPGGTLLSAGQGLSPGSLVCIQAYDPNTEAWSVYEGRVVRSLLKAGGCRHQAGVEFIGPNGQEKAWLHEPDSPRPQPGDLEFLLSVPLLRSIPRKAVCPLLNHIRRRRLLRGERLITQGEAGDTFCIIQSGVCAVKVEVEGREHLVKRLKPGEVVGEMSVLTGEPRSAHVDAETDLELWELTRAQFEAVAGEHPDLRNFLTEMVARRFESRQADPQRRVGKYLVGQKLGAGGWSIVYAGVHELLRMPVAIKMMRHNLAMDTDFLENFRQEARLIAGLNHPNIIKVYDIEELFRTIFIVMEHLQGRSLADELEQLVHLPPAAAADILLQTCRGLHYAHQAGVVHQDIKPANLFLKPDGQIKILDFGLARPVGSEDLDLTGTVHYMAPEQLEGDPVDARTDIFSLGITAYQLCCGQLPHAGEDLNTLVRQRLTEEIPDPGDLAPDLPQGLRRFILTACRRDPAERYPDAQAAAVDLSPLVHNPGPGDRAAPAKARRITSLVLSYAEEERLAVGRILEEFSARLAAAGARLKAAEFEDD